MYRKHDNNRKRRSGTVFMLGGLLLFAAALFLTGYNLWDEQRAGDAVAAILEQMSALQGRAQEGLGATGGQDQKVPDYVRNPDMEMPTVQIDGEAYIGVLEFPSLSVSLPVISDWSAAKLRTAPCRYTGSAYRDNLVIAGHNYRTHFGKLQNLSLGDTVLFFDADGNQFAYEVAGVEELDSTAIEEMVTGDWDLTLFTCTLSGQTRFTVRCIRSE